MAIRYTDLDLGVSGARDFVVRKRTPSLPQLFIIFLIVLMVGVSVIVMVANKTTLIMILCALVAIVGWYVIVQIQRNRDLVMATEFQNSLFASALGINNKFCLIIKRDGNIVYLDRSFQDMFPDFLRQSRRTIDFLLEQGNVSRPDSEKIFSAIEQGVYDKVVFGIRGAGNEFHKMIMSIEPILRPSGFILLRGREFVETRAGGEDAPPSNGKHPSDMQKSTITLFSHVMDTMNMGVYMTGPAGNIIYANPVLEHWLGFRDGQITANNLSLQDIIHQDGNRSDQIEPDNFEGEITLQKKSGGVMKSFINQKVIRDEQGKIMGCTAIVHDFAPQGANVKKKLW